MNRLVQIKHNNLALMPEDERNDYCEYENELTAVKNRENLIKISGDVGAVALSFAGGIIGRGAVLATAAGRARLIEWGVVGSSEAYLAMSALSDYQQLISTCDRQFSDFTNTPNSQKLNSIETCYQNLSQQMLQASLSVVAGSVPIAAGLYKVTSAALAKTIPIVRKESVFTEKVFYKSGAAQYANETGSYTIFDLSRRDLVEREKLEALSEKYLNFVSDEYKKRLNLGKGEVDSFMETSKAYKHRTTYVISTKPGVMKSSGANAATDEIQGGVGLVTSQKKSDLLPLEKATGVTLDRSEGGVAEIVRLTTAKDSPRTVPTELLDQVAQLILGNPSLQTIYIYTSTVHARLYKRYGIYIKEDRKFQGGRDVLLKIDVNELRMHAKLRSAG